MECTYPECIGGRIDMCALSGHYSIPCPDCQRRLIHKEDKWQADLEREINKQCDEEASDER